ncbi:3556_t:CDS:2 [Entrophospora sp. SA101]|nr:3556_t:CDS:2 [Entrophospora sp. SA101]
MAPETRREFASVSDQLSGKLYIHGGVHDIGITTGIFFNDSFILDGNNLSWSQIGKTGLNMPLPRVDHAAVLIANGVIVFIVVLDTTTKPFKWIIPPVTTPEIPINSVTRHQADLIGDYMVVTFGNITNKAGPPLKASNSIQILNIVDYKWVKSFPGLSPSSKASPTTSPNAPPETPPATPPETPPATPPATPPETPATPPTTPSSASASASDSVLSPTILAIVVSVGFALIIAALIGGFLLYCRNRQKKNAQELPSSFNDASSSARSTQMTSLPPPPPSSSQGQINNNDNFMRSISTTTPNSQSPSNHNSIYISNTMDPNLQSRLERSTPSLNNIAIDQTHTNMSTTNQLISEANALAYDQSKVPDSKKYNVIKAKRSNRKAQLDQDATDKASRLAAIQAVNNY